VEFLGTSVARCGSLNNSFGNHLNQLNDVGVVLNALKNVCIIHKDQFLILVSLVLFVEVWALNNF
jgi:hypothetical protein